MSETTQKAGAFTNIKKWVSTHKPAAIALAAVLALGLAGGGTAVGLSVTASAEHSDAVTSWNTARDDYKKAVSDNAKAHKEAVAARTEAAAGIAENDSIISAAGSYASPESVEALNVLKQETQTVLDSSEYGIVEEAAETEGDAEQTPAPTPTPTETETSLDKTVPETKDAIVASTVKYEKATKKLTDETSKVRAFVTSVESSVLDEDIADAVNGIGSSVASAAEGRIAAAGSATDESKAAANEAVAALKTAVEESKVTPDALKKVIDTTTAVEQSNADVIQQQAEEQARSNNSGSTGGGSNGSSRGSNGGGSNGGGYNGGGSSGGGSGSTGGGGSNGGGNSGGGASQTPPTVSGASYGAGGRCAVMGSATSTAGNSVFAPGGVTNYTMSGPSGGVWSITWYVCE